MIDDNSQTIIRRSRVKKTVEESFNGDVSNGQDVLNGKIHSEKNTSLLDESWNVMDYSDYVDYRYLINIFLFIFPFIHKCRIYSNFLF